MKLKSLREYPPLQLSTNINTNAYYYHDIDPLDTEMYHILGIKQQQLQENKEHDHIQHTLPLPSLSLSSIFITFISK